MTLRTRSRGSLRGSRAAGFAPALTSAVVTCMVASLLLAGSGQQEAPVLDGSDAAPASAPAAARAARSTSCTDLLVLGVDGNGQGKKDKPGAAVAKVANKLAASAGREGRSVTVERVRLSTPGAVVLLRTRKGAAAKAVSRPGLKRWKKPVRAGVRATRAKVNARMSSCPEQQVVLVGYAQGAAVVHHVLRDLDAKGRLANVAAAVTVSDPLRVRSSASGRPIGTPAASRKSEGLLTRFAKSAGDVPADTETFGVISVCQKGDLVCNPNKTAARRALALSLSYSAKAGRAAMKKAADRAWARVSLFPVPASQQVVVQAGQPFTQQLAVSGGSRSGPAARWSATSLPPGVTLSPEGVLAGQLDARGTYEVRYTVAGVSPATPPRSSVLLVVASTPVGASTAAGMSSCEVRLDSTAWCWGRNDFGQLGDGTNVLRINPAQVQGGAGWARIATGGSFTCGVRTDSTLWCWGLNNFGQLGGADKETSLVPRQVGTAAVWKDVSASWSHACATQTDGSLWCWGQNVRGQLGAGNTSGRSSAPVRVVGSQQWASVSAGGWHTCATTTSGEGFCWGDNALGQLGDGTTTLRVKPARVTGGHQFAQFTTTWGRTCGVTPSGAALCWGDNANGELGNGSRTDAVTPTPVAGDRTWAQLAAATTATCGSLTDGQVLCWGDGRYGQLGPAGGAGSTTPVASGTTSTGGTVAAGWFHFCGTAGCWGSNDAGQLGNNTIAQTAMPAEPAPPWGPGTEVSTAQVRKWSAKKIAQTAAAGRPATSRVAVQGRAGRRTALGVEMMTFNVLGSQHTAPTGARAAFAPGRIRTEWAKDLIDRRGATLVGLSEPQPDQITSLDVATGGGWTFYPGNTMGYDAAPQSVMWKDSEWEFVWGNTVQMPFMRSSRPQALVRLRNRATGRQVYWINAHLSPGKMQADRDKGMAIIAQLVKQLRGDQLPILVTGDLNEHAKAFRRIACATQMKAAVGGVATKKRCVLPKQMRVDWIFGKGGTFSDTLVDTSPRVRRTTDHAVVSSRFTVQ